MKNQRYIRKFMEGAVTAILWTVCLFVAVVVIKRVLAAFDFASGVSDIPVIFNMLTWYIVVPFVIASVFIAWRYLNILRYRKSSRRSANERFHCKTLWLYGLDRKAIIRLQSLKNQSVLFDKKTSFIHLRDK